MTLPWKEGPPPEGELGSWLVWSEAGGERIAFRIIHGRPLRVHDARPGNEPASGWEASITHHLAEKITPPGESPATASGDDYPLFRRRLQESEERLTEARSLVRDMLLHLRSHGGQRERREIQDLRKRAEELERREG